MGNYLNPDNSKFQRAVNSDIYVDKTGLIKYTNRVMNTMQAYVCVSRPRRFGKSMAADMLTAYYSKGCDSREVFSGLEITEDETFDRYLNKYDTVFLNVQEFLSRSSDVKELIARIKQRVIRELTRQYPDVELFDSTDLAETMQDIYAESKCPFVLIIDEWDCIFREFKNDKEAQEKYLDFLRDLIKDKSYIHLAYMTGILPVKKYGTHSALNMFTEYSMTNPREMAEYFGFTEGEVKELCEEYGRSFEEMSAWYDGYELTAVENGRLKTYSMYNPKSVVDVMISGMFDNYWNQTETYDALKIYIRMNYDGLKDDVIRMLAGDRVLVNTGTFSNDMTTFQGKDDVLTLLIHLGYLSYHWQEKTVSIPNKEVAQEYVNAIGTMGWKEVMDSIEKSRKLLEAMWNMDGDTVAQGIDRAHQEISILKYNDENALSCTINLAFYFAREYYTIIRELPAGKGFADICLIPRKIYADKPAAVIELKWNKSVEGAIAQIKEKKYVDALKDYQGNILLVAVNYDKKTKKHSCEIEKLEISKSKE